MTKFCALWILIHFLQLIVICCVTGPNHDIRDLKPLQRILLQDELRREEFFAFKKTTRIQALCNEFSIVDFNVLFDMFTDMYGSTWNWNPQPEAGVPWNFTGYVLNDASTMANPCTNFWQGVVCNECADDSSQCCIEELYCNARGMKGFLPHSIGNLTSVVRLELGYNHMIGRIPETIGNLVHITDLSLKYNDFSDHLPTSLTNLSTMTYLTIENNNLTGPLPSDIGKLTLLGTLNLNDNHLTGPIPDALTTLSRLNILSLYANTLTGPIPQNFSRLTNLTSFAAYDNFLTGEIPEYVGSMTQLNVLFLSGNRLHGRIPANLNQLSQLLQLEFSVNRLTGPLPPFDSFYQIESLQFDQNRLTGRIPRQLSALKTMKYFNLSTNLFTGPVPPQFYNLTGLSTLDVSDNQLTGNPTLFTGQLTSLQVLFLQQNQFAGSISSMADCSRQDNLTNIDISDNAFTGTIPTSLFGCKLLTTFAAVSNCLHGAIPEDVCDARLLKVLALNGIATSPSCQQPIVPFLTHSGSYIVKQSVGGNIPLCLFSMSSIESLYLSGNLIQGELPSDLNVSQRLRYLSLSHNDLKGAVPLSIQLNSWLLLDLSFNKFTGVLASDFPAVPIDASLRLEVNRLSGNIPSSLLDAFNITILKGNIFDCGFSDNELPSNDPDADNYQCGSLYIYISLVVWTVVLGALVTVVGFTYCYLLCGSPNDYVKDLQRIWTALARRISGWFSDPQVALEALYRLYDNVINIRNHFQRDQSDCHPRLRNVFNFITALECLRAISLVAAALSVVCLLPVFGALTTSYNSYVNEYGWSPSAAFKSGTVPAIIMLLVLSAFLVVFALLWLCWFQNLVDSGRSSKQRSSVAISVEPSKESVLNSILSRMHEVAPAEASGNDSVHQGSMYDDISERFDSTTKSHLVRDRWRSLFSIISIDCAYFAPSRYTLVIVLLVLLNCVLVVGVNVGYILVVLNNDRNVIIATGIALALFKLMWNEVMFVWLTAIRSVFNSKTQQCEQLSPRSAAVSASTGGLKSDSGIDVEESKDVLPSLGRRSLDDQVALELDDKHRYKFHRSNVLFLTVVVIFNTVVSPCIAIATVNPSCFAYVFVQPPVVYSTYYFDQCTIQHINGPCVRLPREHTTGYVPPFTYSYQCSSFLVTSYTFVFVFMFIANTFGTTVMYSVLALSFQRMHANVAYWKDSWLFWFVDFFTPLVAKPPHHSVAATSESPAALDHASQDIPMTTFHSDRSELSGQNSSMSDIAELDYGNTAPTTAPTADHRDAGWLQAVRRRLSAWSSTNYATVFHKDKFVVRLIMIVSILLSFGAVYPPLAVVGIISIYIKTYFVQHTLLRYVKKRIDSTKKTNRISAAATTDGVESTTDESASSSDPPAADSVAEQRFVDPLDFRDVLSRKHVDTALVHADLRAVDMDCGYTAEVLVGVIWPLVLFTVLFYAFFIFDTYGDDVGWQDALSAPLTLIFTTAACYLARSYMPQRLDSFRLVELLKALQSGWQSFSAAMLGPLFFSTTDSQRQNQPNIPATSSDTAATTPRPGTRTSGGRTNNRLVSVDIYGTRDTFRTTSSSAYIIE